MFDKIEEECGVFGIIEKERADVAHDTYLALYALQHRGQESCGMAVNDDGVFTSYKDPGLVPEVFTTKAMETLGVGNMAIGHVRYSTLGVHSHSNAQPLVVRHVKGALAIAHNGTITNSSELRQKFELEGAIFHGTNDTEVIAYCITKHRLTTGSIEEAVSAAMKDLKGAYSLVVMSPTKLIAARDPVGFRPLSIGTMPNGAVVFASETCAFDAVGAKFLRNVKAGEIVVATKDGMTSMEKHCTGRGKLCVFEFVYFSRPDSIIENASVHKARKRAGEFLSQEHPIKADVVVGVPDSGLDAAIGYSEESGIPYGVGFIKNRYVGRTFIQPTQGERANAVKIKLNVIEDTVKGKSVVLIDDSIVRGTTCARIVDILREAGAKEVHMRVSSPPFLHPCYFGTDIDSREKLIAHNMSVDEIAKKIGVDSLGYLSVEGVNKIAENPTCDFCDGCFTGSYPSEVPENASKNKFETKISENQGKNNK